VGRCWWHPKGKLWGWFEMSRGKRDGKLEGSQTKGLVHNGTGIEGITKGGRYKVITYKA